MNNARRREITRAQALIEEAKSILETTEGEEREAFDSMPEGLQQGERGQKVEASADALQEAIDALGEASEKALEAIEK